jgi:murein DD-endopeptidase MepM/ murein hydrolase activator NlpD
MSSCFFRRAVFSAALSVAGNVFAQSPFQFPTANHALFTPGAEAKFFAPTAPDKPVTSGGFGCVRNSGTRMHEGLDILHLHTDKRGEPTDPVFATADGTVAYASDKPGLSNYGRYVVVQHQIGGLEIYSLYAHLSAIAPGIVTGKHVAAGETIATMGRTSTAEVITKDRAHVHFELNVFINDRFASWFKQNAPGERNDHGNWNGQNLDGLDACEILLAERPGQKKFNVLEFLRGQRELCRVQVRAKDFPFLKRYAALVQKNPVAEKSGVAGYEISLNYNGVAFALVPRAESELKSRSKIFLLSVDAAIERANPCRKLVTQRGAKWELTDKGRREIELLIY